MQLLHAVLNVILEGHAESYLCYILLMNLAFLEDAKIKLVRYTSEGEEDDPLENRKSLLRTMELLMKMYTRFLAAKVLSV